MTDRTRRARAPPVRAHGAHVNHPNPFITITIRKEHTMQIMFINNDGAGFADRIVVRDNLTVRELFSERMHGRNPADFLIRVNRQPVDSEYVLRENDRVSFTPTKIHGAA